MLKFLASSCLRLIFSDSGSVPFFCRKNLGGSIRKNGKLTGLVCFVNRALFFLMESANKLCAEHH